MSLAVRLLGTSASRPTVERNVASIALVREGETLLFDCGEGTQRQMMRYGVSFALGDLFFTHFHADHVIGVIGLMRTMSLQGRTEPLRLWRIPLPRIGLGYRFGDDLSVYRLVFGTPF
jgi:ribonuclease Z